MNYRDLATEIVTLTVVSSDTVNYDNVKDLSICPKMDFGDNKGNIIKTVVPDGTDDSLEEIIDTFDTGYYGLVPKLEFSYEKRIEYEKN